MATQRQQNIFVLWVFVLQIHYLLGKVCDNYMPFSNEDRRNILFQFSGNGQHAPLSDNYLPTRNYYGNPGYTLARSAPPLSHCGTLYPIWVKDYPLYGVPGQKQDVIACVVASSNCSRQLMVTVHFCNNYHVYRLQQTPSDSAYCLEKDQYDRPIPKFIPSPEVEVKLDNSGFYGRTEFLCQFDASTSEKDLLYEVIWYVNQGQLHGFASMEWSPEIHHKTRLTEDILARNGQTTVGFNVHCGARARFNKGFPGGKIGKSADHFIGITIDPSYIAINNDEQKTVHLKPSIPFGCGKDARACTLQVNVYQPDEHDQCSEKALQKSACGVVMNSTISEPLKISGELSQVIGDQSVETRLVLRTEDKLALPFWSKYDIGYVKVTLTRKPSIVDHKKCLATGDPHMITFDGGMYDIHMQGTFHLYKHSRFPFEIQIKTKMTGRVAWVRAIAIRAGLSVHIVDVCSGQLTNEPVQCEADGLSVIKIKDHGQHFKFVLPSGMEIKVELYKNSLLHYLNVYVFPAFGDAEKTTGLCGNLNCKCDDDFQTRLGSTLEYPEACSGKSSPRIDKFSESWKVGVDENLFTYQGRQRLTTMDGGFTYCNCTKPFSTNRDRPWNEGSTCSDSRRSLCYDKDDLFKDKSRPCKAKAAREKRSVPNEDDHIGKRESPTEWINGWTEVKARQTCQEAFDNSAIVKACKQYIQTDIDTTMVACITDIKLLGSDDLVQSSVESLKTLCMHYADIHPELKNPGENGEKSAFDNITDAACIQDCNNRGSCSKGRCTCDPPYGGADCSVDLQQPPTISLDNDGYCDLQNDECKEQIVKGDYFVDTDKLLCRVTSFRIDEDGNIILDSVSNTKPTVHHFAEIACPVQNYRKKRSLDVTKLDQARGFRIAITNNGNVYSNESVMVVYNSGCQRCEIKTSSVSCSFTTTSCVAQGQCISPGKTYPGDGCLICDKSGSATWKQSSNCGDGKPLWIIGAVLGTVAVVALVGILLFKTMNRKRVHVESPPPYTEQNGNGVPPTKTKL